MRVITGTYRGRIIKEVPGELTRPTTDKNKEKIFNILGQYFDGGKVLDLFAGSGALGIEALSRGMDYCVFVDYQGKAIQTIHENLKTLKIDKNHSKVVTSEAMQFMRSYQGEPFDLIILDPPYAKNYIPDLLDMIASRKLLSATGVVLCENDKATTLPDSYANLKKQRESIEGITKFTFYLWEESQ
ncbi:MAG: 16S rRNA (guanine(966)-N(2))-methyltransferase RsmD [Tenericutes bacterium HGW-Tenericutes-1]|jgi:16S rRNA (guanine(966)-N(2))-methyltransferase RsmD|nr:MAG: 16S rRNA (guanine(966)-N(2))-methyltransferase RsmD [Tenericutes bacterium HGW-Tenericutes-1]